MQKKVNAPCNNQLKRIKNENGRQKEGKLRPRKLSPKKSHQKNKKHRNPQVPPKEQEASECPSA
jgi:hypothetical protein